MDDTLQFDEVRFKSATAIFWLGWKEYNRSTGLLEKKLRRGWTVSPDEPGCMIHPERLNRAIRYLDICLELWPDLTGEDGNACTALNIKALALRALGDYQAAAKAYAEILAATKSKVAQEGLEYCNRKLNRPNTALEPTPDGAGISASRTTP